MFANTNKNKTTNANTKLINNVELLKNCDIKSLVKFLQEIFKDKRKNVTATVKEICNLEIKDVRLIDEAIVKFSAVNNDWMKVTIFDLGENDNDAFSYVIDKNEMGTIVDISDTCTNKKGIVIISIRNDGFTNLISIETKEAIPNVNVR